MFFLQPLSSSKHFICQLNDSLEELGASKLSTIQQLWFAICITGILVTNSLCWKRFERAGFGQYNSGTLSAMFRRGKLCWERLLIASVKMILKKYGITEGILALDGTDNHRSKNTKKIDYVGKEIQCSTL